MHARRIHDTRSFSTRQGEMSPPTVTQQGLKERGKLRREEQRLCRNATSSPQKIPHCQQTPPTDRLANKAAASGIQQPHPRQFSVL